MKNTLLLCTLFAALVVSVGVRAADTAELKVAGSVRPPSCTLNLAAGGVIDYGNIPPSRLSASAATPLERRITTFNIDCATGKTRMALKLSDNRASSVVPAIGKVSGAGLNDKLVYGLGIVDGKKVGVYTVGMTNVKVDGYSPYLYMIFDGAYAYQATNHDGWTNNYGPDASYFESAKMYSWSPNIQQGGSQASTFSPGAFSTVSGELMVQVTIDKLSNLPVRDTIPLDGSATLELMYL